MPRITLTSDVGPPDLGLPSGPSEKSFAIALHLKLPVDFLELEPEFLLFNWETLIDVLFSFFSAKASKSVEPTVAALSPFEFHVLGSVVTGSGLS